MVRWKTQQLIVHLSKKCSKQNTLFFSWKFEIKIWVFLNIGIFRCYTVSYRDKVEHSSYESLKCNGDPIKNKPQMTYFRDQVPLEEHLAERGLIKTLWGGHLGTKNSWQVLNIKQKIISHIVEFQKLPTIRASYVAPLDFVGQWMSKDFFKFYLESFL